MNIQSLPHVNMWLGQIVQVEDYVYLMFMFIYFKSQYLCFLLIPCKVFCCICKSYKWQVMKKYTFITGILA